MSQLFLDTLYPVRCVNCDACIRRNILMLCTACLTQLSVASEKVINSVLFQDGIPDTSSRCRICHALWIYDPDSPTRALQHHLKYKGHRKLAVRLGNLLALNYLRFHPEGARFDMIVPVPVHRVRFLERGYNQAAEIARGVSETLQIPLEEKVLIRRMISPSQVKHAKAEREENLKNAFALASSGRFLRRREPGSLISGNNILLIDDVMTTGSTLRSAIRTLSTADVSGIGIAVLFVVPPGPV